MSDCHVGLFQKDFAFIAWLVSAGLGARLTAAARIARTGDGHESLRAA